MAKNIHKVNCDCQGCFLNPDNRRNQLLRLLEAASHQEQAWLLNPDGLGGFQAQLERTKAVKAWRKELEKLNETD